MLKSSAPRGRVLTRVSVLTCLACSIVNAQGHRRELGHALDAYLAPLVAAHEFSGNIIVRRGDQVVAQRSYGMANREFGIANDSSTRFLVGSISKQFTAAAIFALAERGKLSTADHLDKYVRDFPRGGEITIDQMLKHTSGISRDLANAADAVTPHSGAELVEIIRLEPLAFAPGTSTAYSNNAYKILAYIVEQVSGEPYGSFLEQNFLRPLGMRNTGDFASLTLVPHLASGYSPGFGADGFGPSPHLDISNSRGAASIYSTAKDLTTWSANFLIRGEVLPGVRDSLLAGEGRGTGVRRTAGRTVVSHDGVYQGFTAFIATILEDSLTIVYLGNTETAASVSPLQDALSQLVNGKTVAPARVVARSTTTAPGNHADYVGVFEFFPGLRVRIRTEGNTLVLGTSDGAYPIEWTSPDHGFYRLKYADIMFSRDAGGKVSTITWTEAGHTYSARRIP